MGLYKHHLLADRIKDMRPFERHVGLMGDRVEHILTLSITTSVEGLICVILGLETRNEPGEMVGAVALAQYPLSQQPHAQEDALLLSRKWGITLKRANPQTGWEIVRNADAPDSTDGRGLIIGS